MELLSRDRTICGGLFAAQRVRNRRFSVWHLLADGVSMRPAELRPLRRESAGRPMTVTSFVDLQIGE
jgi:hypothetical protein